MALRLGHPKKATHDHKRNGTTILFAALEVATGIVTDHYYRRHRKAEFGDSPGYVVRAYPHRELQIVVDSDRTHKHTEI